MIQIRNFPGYSGALFPALVNIYSEFRENREMPRHLEMLADLVAEKLAKLGYAGNSEFDVLDDLQDFLIALQTKEITRRHILEQLTGGE